MPKLDTKSLLKTSLTTPANRFDKADQVMEGRKGGLLESEPSFSAETGIISVPVEVVYDNIFNARSIYIQSVIEERAKSLTKDGQLTPAPAVVHPRIKGAYMLIDGHYRLRALKVAQIKTIKLDVRTYTSEVELYNLSWSYNNERSSQSTLDNALAWKRLLDEKVVTEADQIAEMTGQTKANISKTMALLKLPQRALDRISLHPDKVGIAVGYELSLCAKVMSEDELVKFVAAVIEENYSSRAIEKYRVSLEAGKKRKAREINASYQIESTEVQGLMKEWESGRITLDIQVSDPAKRLALINELKEKFPMKVKSSDIDTNKGDDQSDSSFSAETGGKNE